MEASTIMLVMFMVYIMSYLIIIQNYCSFIGLRNDCIPRVSCDEGCSLVDDVHEDGGKEGDHEDAKKLP